MTRVEKRIMMILGILGLIIIISQIMIQIADSEINDYDKTILIEQGRNNNILLNKQDVLSKVYRLESIKLSSRSIIPVHDVLNDLNLTSDRYKDISIKFERGEISSDEFLNNMTNYFVDVYTELSIMYENSYSETEKKYANGTPWSFWKNVFIDVQIGLVIISIGLYLYLYSKLAKIK